MTERLSPLILADAGYFSRANLAACARRGLAVAIPEGQSHPAHPYHKDRFPYDPNTDSYTCQQGMTLIFSHLTRRKNNPTMWVYRAPRSACRRCPASSLCTRNQVQGRLLEVTIHKRALRAHRRWMATPWTQARFRRRKKLVEPAFGILKEQQGARRFSPRGLEATRSDWSLLAAEFNLRALWKVKGRSTGGLPLQSLSVTLCLLP